MEIDFTDEMLEENIIANDDKSQNDRSPDSDFKAAKLYLKGDPTPIIRSSTNQYDLKTIPGVTNSFSKTSVAEMSELYDILRGLLSYEDKRPWTKNGGQAEINYRARCFAQGVSVYTSSKSLRGHSTAKVDCKAGFYFCISHGHKMGVITFTKPHCAECLEQSPEFLKNSGTIFTQLASPGRLKSLCQDASIMMNNDKALSAAAVSKQFVGKVSAVSKIPTNLLLSEDGVIPRPPRVIMDRLMRDARQHSIAGRRRCNQCSFEY